MSRLDDTIARLRESSTIANGMRVNSRLFINDVDGGVVREIPLTIPDLLFAGQELTLGRDAQAEAPPRE